MNRHFAHALAFATTTAAVFCAAAIASSPAYAEGPILEDPPFVGTLARADVRAELMSRRELLSASGGEWTMQRNHAAPAASRSTGEQVRAEYLAAREEVRALTSEDSGSSYLAAQRMRIDGDTVVAGLGR